MPFLEFVCPKCHKRLGVHSMGEGGIVCPKEDGPDLRAVLEKAKRQLEVCRDEMRSCGAGHYTGQLELVLFMKEIDAVLSSDSGSYR